MSVQDFQTQLCGIHLQVPRPLFAHDRPLASIELYKLPQTLTFLPVSLSIASIASGSPWRAMQYKQSPPQSKFIVSGVLLTGWPQVWQVFTFTGMTSCLDFH